MELSQSRLRNFYVHTPLLLTVVVMSLLFFMIYRCYFGQFVVTEQCDADDAGCAIRIDNVSYKNHTVSFDVVVPTEYPGIFIFPNLRYDYLKKYEYKMKYGRGSSLHATPSDFGEYIPYKVEKGKIYIFACYMEITAGEVDYPYPMLGVKMYAGERITRSIRLSRKSTVHFDWDRYTGKAACLLGIDEIIIQVGYMVSPSLLKIPQETSWEKNLSWGQYRYILKQQQICEKHFCVK